jgi:hypothetical protein
MVSMVAKSAVDRGFEYRACQIKNNKIGIYCFPAKHAALMRKSIDLLAQNQDNVSECGNTTCLSVDFCFSELALEKSN